MKTLAAKKLCLIGVVFIIAFAFVYAASNGTSNTKSLKKHTDFIDKYVLYDFGEGHGHWVHFVTPTTLSIQEFGDTQPYDANYGFSDLGGQTFFITWVDDNGNTKTQILNAKKSTAVAHSVTNKSKSPAAGTAKVSVAPNKATATKVAVASASSNSSSSTNK